MVEIKIEYDGQLRCNAVHTPSNCQIHTDAPVDNHGKGESFSPTDLVATALGSCVATIMAICANKHGIELKGVRVSVEKHMSQDPPRRIARLPVTVTIPFEIPEPAKSAIEKAANHCPVHKSLRADIDAPIDYIYSVE